MALAVKCEECNGPFASYRCPECGICICKKCYDISEGV